jgi:hypothetical protein
MAEQGKRPARKGRQGKTEPPAAQAAAMEIPPHIAWAVATAVVLVVLATGLFAAGFFTNQLVSDEGGTSAVAQPTTPKATASPQPTALPAIAVSVDDAPGWGPADAKVAIVEFGDYQ